MRLAQFDTLIREQEDCLIQYTRTRRNNGRVISASGSSYKCCLLTFDLTRDNA